MAVSRGSDFISEARSANRKVWDGINELVALQREYNALDYGSSLPDGTGINEGITRQNVGSVVFDTANAMATLLSQGYATNMARLL